MPWAFVHIRHGPSPLQGIASNAYTLRHLPSDATRHFSASLPGWPGMLLYGIDLFLQLLDLVVAHALGEGGTQGAPVQRIDLLLQAIALGLDPGLLCGLGFALGLGFGCGRFFARRWSVSRFSRST